MKPPKKVGRIATAPGAIRRVPGTRLPLINPLSGFGSKLALQLEHFPFEKNVFMMMRFRESNKDLSDFIVETLASVGYHGVRADDAKWDITKNVYNPIAVLYCCKYGIALFDEAETNQAYNANVVYELAMMQCLGRDCLILRNDSLPPVPFDLIKDLHNHYKSDIAVRKVIKSWLLNIVPEAARTNLDASSAERDYSAAVSPGPAGSAVIDSPPDVLAENFGWKISRKTPKTCDLDWRVELTSASMTSRQVILEVLFWDEDGFALESDTEGLRLPANERTRCTRTIQTSPKIAGRVHHASLTILKG